MLRSHRPDTYEAEADGLLATLAAALGAVAPGTKALAVSPCRLRWLRGLVAVGGCSGGCRGWLPWVQWMVAVGGCGETLPTEVVALVGCAVPLLLSPWQRGVAPV